MDSIAIVIHGKMSDGEKFSVEIPIDAEVIDLSEKQLINVDLSQVQQCSRLKSIYLGKNQLTHIDLSPLESCADLQLLDFADNQLIKLDLSPIQSCLNLERLTLGNNKLVKIDLAPLQSSKSFELLDLANNQLSSIDLTPLKHCRFFMSLLLQKNQLKIIDLAPLQSCHYLAWLYLHANRLSKIDLSPLQQCVNLNTLDLAGNQLTSIDLAPLQQCSKLIRVGLAGNQLMNTDLAPLGNCLNLRAIDLRDNQLNAVDLTPLQPCSSLERLYLSGNRFDAADLSSLEDFSISNLEALQDLFDLSPDQVINIALSNPEGCATLIFFHQRWLESERPIEGKIWRAFRKAAINWWKDPRTQHWYSEKIVEALSHRITSETLINFLVGSNDLNSDMKNGYKDLRDEQRSLLPHWFAEFPLQMLHGEKYLKIRLNNLVWTDGKFASYPTLDEKQSLPPIKRLKMKIETRWHQIIEVDHIFSPNTDEERKLFNRDPNSAWLTDIVVMDLAKHLQTEDALVLSYSIQCFFDAENPNPDIQTPTRKIVIPVVRTKNYQNVQKFLLKHSQVLTLALAIFSIGMSVITTLFNYYSPISEIIGEFSSIHLAVLGGTGFIFLLISIAVIIWLVKQVNQDKRDDRVNPA